MDKEEQSLWTQRESECTIPEKSNHGAKMGQHF